MTARNVTTPEKALRPVRSLPLRDRGKPRGVLWVTKRRPTNSLAVKGEGGASERSTLTTGLLDFKAGRLGLAAEQARCGRSSLRGERWPWERWALAHRADEAQQRQAPWHESGSPDQRPCASDR